ncbi:MAG: cyclase family protein [Candidatus Thermoplasmatota archaeon]|nr:cyclase family protein [Candidatus Thermoplasmatota archaeon]
MKKTSRSAGFAVTKWFGSGRWSKLIDYSNWKFSKIQDVTWKLNNSTPIYPGDPPLNIEQVKNEVKPYIKISKITMGSHTGTHIDAPYHMLENGFKLDEIPITNLVGPVKVVQIRGKNVEPEDVPSGYCERVLFKTTIESYSGAFRENFSFISKEAAGAIMERNIKLIGIDYLSIDEYNFVEPDAHWALLGKGITVIEALDLRNVEPGEYFLVALPLNISADASPCRVILLS